MATTTVDKQTQRIAGAIASRLPAVPELTPKEQFRKVLRLAAKASDDGTRRAHSHLACAKQELCCALHHPSNHHMRLWPVVVRYDKGGLTERVCKHGIGHPDPDSVAYFKAKGREVDTVHGCCGCCSGEAA